MSTAHAPSPLAVWIEAARPRTLPASVAPVLVGTAASDRLRDWLAGGAQAPSWVRFLLALFVALALQIAVNYANDYFDGVGGVDTEERVGPRRAVAAGLVPPTAMKRAMLLTLAAAGLAGLALAALAGWELLLVGGAALVATLGYSGGPRPYASVGLGEVFVFVFFGLVATAGSAYVQDEGLSVAGVLAAVPMGLLATALLVVNNLRDIPTDRAVGKRTLAVRLGGTGTRRLYVGLVGGAYLALAPLTLATGQGWLLLPVLSLPLALKAVAQVRSAPIGPQLIEALGRTAGTQLVFAGLLAAGMILRGVA